MLCRHANGQTVYSQFGPANGVLFGATTTPITRSATATDFATLFSCAANQLVYSNASGALTCNAALTFNGSQIVTLSHATNPQYRALVSGGIANQRLWEIGFDSTNGFSVIPLLDAGVDTTNTHLRLTRTAGGIDTLEYLDDNGELVQFQFNDILLQGSPTSLPGVRLDDPSLTSGGSFFEAGYGGSSGSPTVAGYLLCVGASIGQTLTNGPAGAHCDVTTGEVNLLTVDANIPLSLGTNSIDALDISNVNQGMSVPGVTGGNKGTGTLNVKGAFVNGSSLNPILVGTSASLGGSPLLAGACTAGTVTITGAGTTMAAVASPSSDPDSSLSTGIAIYAFVSASNTVTVRLCAIVAVTPAASTYNVRVIP